MPKPQIVPALQEHIHAMAPHLRADDVREIWCSGGWNPLEGLQYSLDHSEAYTALIPGSNIPAAMFGIGKASILDNRRSIWLLGTDQVQHYKKRLVQQSGDYINLLGAGCTVYNYVLSSNELSLKWLHWLGFRIMRPKPWGLFQKDFCYVEKEIPLCAHQPPQ